jgi:hypothetical protein
LTDHETQPQSGSENACYSLKGDLTRNLHQVQLLNESAKWKNLQRENRFFEKKTINGDLAFGVFAGLLGATAGSVLFGKPWLGSALGQSAAWSIIQISRYGVPILWSRTKLALERRSISKKTKAIQKEAEQTHLASLQKKAEILDRMFNSPHQVASKELEDGQIEYSITVPDEKNQRIRPAIFIFPQGTITPVQEKTISITIPSSAALPLFEVYKNHYEKEDARKIREAEAAITALSEVLDQAPTLGLRLPTAASPSASSEIPAPRQITQ